jgi:hypothetical protein
VAALKRRAKFKTAIPNPVFEKLCSGRLKCPSRYPAAWIAIFTMVRQMQNAPSTGRPPFGQHPGDHAYQVRCADPSTRQIAAHHPLLLPSTRIPHNCASVTVRPQPSSDRLGISKSRVVWKMRRRFGWFGNNFTFGKLAANCLNCVVSFGVLGPTLHKIRERLGLSRALNHDVSALALLTNKTLLPCRCSSANRSTPKMDETIRCHRTFEKSCRLCRVSEINGTLTMGAVTVVTRRAWSVDI